MIKCGWIVLAAGLGMADLARSAVPNSLVLNEVNTVSTLNFLDSATATDLTLGRLQGNGQNWMEFLVVQGDDLGAGQFANTLDLRGWKIEWSYDKNDPTDPDKFGAGTITFSNDPLWAAVPRGSLITFNEWQRAWYRDIDMDPPNNNGFSRIGGVNGLGETVGDPKQTGDEERDFSTDVRWNPNSDGGGENGDWRIHVWAGERNPDTSFKYFTFAGSVVDGDPTMPKAVGAEGGLFAANNDNWQWTIKDAADNVIQGPFGEALSSGGWSVNSREIIRLEAFPSVQNPTQATYLGTAIPDYQDGSSGSYGLPNIWSGGSGVQDLSALRNWLVPGDADLNGRVDGNDVLVWQRNQGATNASLTQGDLNGDLLVNAGDLALWKMRASAAAQATVGVPECGGSILMSIAAASVWCGARRRR